jgi:hypothetical protein
MPPLAILALLLGLPLLGYLWPLPEPKQPLTSDDAWTWPAAAQYKSPTAAPEKLATFWPGKTPASPKQAGATETAKGLRHDWRLIGVIRQGRQSSALIQDPEGSILTLKPGDALDPQRRISQIAPTRLRWQDREGKTGELPLYPEPDAATVAPADTLGATATTETRE